MRVLLIEDDTHLGDALKRYLEKEGHNCNWIDDDREVFLVLNSEAFDIVVLDLILKFTNGEGILKKIKEKYDLPVIVLTAKIEIRDKEICFNLGADDYITKPFHPKELILRINSVCRRYYGKEVVRVKDIEIDLEKKTVKKNELLIDLTNKDWQLLELLVRNRGKLVSNNMILNYVWPYTDTDENSIRAYVKRLRKILGGELIKNVKGRGYTFLE